MKTTYTFTISNLDKPNKNNHVYTKEAIDKLFSSKHFIGIQNGKCLGLTLPIDVTSSEGATDLSTIYSKKVAGIITLKNKYPQIIGEIKILDTPAAKKLPAYFYPMMNVAINDSETFGDLMIINDFDVYNFEVSASSAFNDEGITLDYTSDESSDIICNPSICIPINTEGLNSNETKAVLNWVNEYTNILRDKVRDTMLPKNSVTWVDKDGKIQTISDVEVSLSDGVTRIEQDKDCELNLKMKKLR